MLAEGLRLVLAGALAAGPAAGNAVPSSVPPPRPVEAMKRRPPPARPLAVVTVGVGALTLASSLTLLGLGIHTIGRASRGFTEGEAHAYVHNGKNLVIVGSALAAAGVAILAGGIVWVVRDRRRARAALAKR